MSSQETLTLPEEAKLIQYEDNLLVVALENHKAFLSHMTLKGYKIYSKKLQFYFSEAFYLGHLIWESNLKPVIVLVQ